MSWKSEQRPRRHPEAAFRTYDGESVVVLPSGAEINVLNRSGALVFEMLDGRHSVSDIAAAIHREYEVGVDEARRDLETFLDDLQAHRMLA